VQLALWGREDVQHLTSQTHIIEEYALTNPPFSLPTNCVRYHSCTRNYVKVNLDSKELRISRRCLISITVPAGTLGDMVYGCSIFWVDVGRGGRRVGEVGGQMMLLAEYLDGCLDS